MSKCWLGTVGPFYGSVRCDTAPSDSTDMVRLSDITDGSIFGSKVRVFYGSDSSLSPSPSPQRLFFPNVAYDENSNYNKVLGVFTAPDTGYYSVTLKLAIGFPGLGANCNMAIYLYKNASMHSGFGQVVFTTSGYVSLILTDVIQLISGNTVSAYALQTDGVARNIVGGGPYSYLTITRIP